MARKLWLKTWMATGVMAGVLTTSILALADDTKSTAKPGVDAKTAFARLKTLAGTWQAKAVDETNSEHKKDKADEHPREALEVFKVTGAGSALVETQHPGSNHEMVSVYHLDGDDLRMTHYCAAQNQPHVKLDRTNSTPDHFIFVFDGGTNFDPEKDMHIHGVKITFEKDGKVVSDWESYVGGKKAMTTSFHLSRQSESQSAHSRLPVKAATAQ